LIVRRLALVLGARSSPKWRDFVIEIVPFFRSMSPTRSAVHSLGRMPVQNIVNVKMNG
jgi:hypothetical protein